MNIIAKNENIIPAQGNYIARCYEIMNIENQKIRMFFELPETNKGDEKPYTVTKDFLLTLKKSKLRQFLEAWTDEEIENNYDVYQLVGVPASIRIHHRRNNEGEQYADIISISPRSDCPEQINKSVQWLYRQTSGNYKELNPDEFLLRVRLSENVLTDSDMQPFIQIVNAKTLPRWEYKSGHTEAYFRVIEEPYYSQLLGLKDLKGWTDEELKIEVYTEI